MGAACLGAASATLYAALIWRERRKLAMSDEKGAMLAPSL